MATYYVKNGGSDAAAGTDVAPWAHCPGMLGWTGSATLAAGDIIYFDSASTFTSNSSGENAFLELKGGVTYYGASWGAGTRAKFDFTSGWNFYDAMVWMRVDHATIESLFSGFEIDGNHAGAAGTGISAIAYGGWDQAADMNGALKTISDCVVHDIGDATYTQATYGIAVSGAQGHSVQNVAIIGNTCYNIGSDIIAIYPTSGGTTPTLNSCANILIRGNECYAGGLAPDQGGAGILIKNNSANVIAEFNYVHDSLQGISIDSNGATFTAVSGAIVRYNIVKDLNDAPGLYLTGNFSGTRTVDFYGNMVVGGVNYGLHVTAATAGTAQNLKIYNNTFYNNVDAGIVVNHPTITHSYDVQNNIIFIGAGAIAALWIETVGDVGTHNNNLYYRAGGGTIVHNGASNYTAANVSAFEPTAQTADPGFKNIAALPTGFSGTYGTDLVPNPGGLALGASSSAACNNGAALTGYEGGINISGIAGGYARPLGGGWDIGAYELMPAAATGSVNVEVKFA